MRAINFRNLRRIDWMLPIFVISLAVIGWVTMYSASSHTGGSHHQKQVMFFVMGAVIAGGIICIDYRSLVALAPLMYLVVVLLLVAVLVFGKEIKGSQRWLDLGFFGIQPSELAKMVMVYFLAWYLHTLGPRIRKLHWFMLTFVLVGVPALLILKQPDLGTAACLGPLVIIMLFVRVSPLAHRGGGAGRPFGGAIRLVSDSRHGSKSNSKGPGRTACRILRDP